MFCVVGENGIGRDLATRARRRGDMRHGKRDGRVPARKDLLVRPLLHGEGRDRLCRVHGRAAADRNDEVGARAFKKRDALPYAGNGGIGRDAVIDGRRLPVRF